MAGSASTLLAIAVPLVAVEDEAYHHPSVFSNVALVRLLQPSNADQPMLVTLSGIVIFVKPLQLENGKGLNLSYYALPLMNTP